MVIKTVSDMDRILRNYDTNSWAKDSEIGTIRLKGPMDLKDAPQIPMEQGETQKSFGDWLKDSIAQVNSLQQNANVAMEKLATGQSKNLHETMIAVEQADIAFKQMNQIRLKVLEAYKEIMRMQI